MFNFEDWSSDDENVCMPFGRHEFVQVLPRSKAPRLPAAVHACRIMRPVPVGFSVRSLSSFLRWTECDGNIYGLEVIRNDMDELERFHGLSSKRHKLWIFNVATKMWKLRHLHLVPEYREIPLDLGSNFMCCHSGSLLCNGCGTDVYRWPLDGSYGVTRWIPEGDIGIDTTLGSCKKIKNCIYSIGGQRRLSGDVVCHCDVNRLSLKSLCWDQLYSSGTRHTDPPGFNLHELVYDDKFIYVLGGLRDDENFHNFKQAYAFAYKRRHTWHCVPLLADARDGTYPTGRRSFACEQHTAHDGTVEVFIVGGVFRYMKCQDFWKLNMSTRQWTCLCINFPISFYSAECLPNGCMYIFSSYFPISGRSNKVMKIWLRIPTLSEMCWDVITGVNPHINKFDSVTLLAAGIPSHFISRLHPPEINDMVYPRLQI